MKRIILTLFATTALCAVAQTPRCIPEVLAHQIQAAMPQAADAEAAPAGLGEHPDNWRPLGKGSYTEDMITGIVYVPNHTWEVDIEENAVQPGVYRIVNPYGPGCPYVTDGVGVPFNIIINAQDPDGVYLEEVVTGLDVGYGAVTFSSWCYYHMQNGDALEDLKANYGGTLRNGVIIFPKKYLMIQMAGYVDNARFYANCNRMGIVHLPGSKSLDFTATGTQCMDNGGDIAIDWQSSGDFDEIRYLFKKAYDGTNYYGENEKSFVQATETGQPLTAPSGTMHFNVSESGRGKYLCVFAATSGGKIMARKCLEFFYDPEVPGEWIDCDGPAKYVDDLIPSVFSIPTRTITCPVQRHATKTGFFRLVNPYKDFVIGDRTFSHDDSHNHYIYLHTEDLRQIYIEESRLGLDIGWGECKVTSTPALYSMWGNPWDAIVAINTMMPIFGEYDIIKKKVSFIKEHLRVSMAGIEGGDFQSANLHTRSSITLPEPAGADDAIADGGDSQDDAPQYFTLTGQRIARPSPGQLVLERRGHRVTKTVIK